MLQSFKTATVFFLLCVVKRLSAIYDVNKYFTAAEKIILILVSLKNKKTLNLPKMNKFYSSQKNLCRNLQIFF